MKVKEEAAQKGRKPYLSSHGGRKIGTEKRSNETGASKQQKKNQKMREELSSVGYLKTLISFSHYVLDGPAKKTYVVDLRELG